MMYCDRRIIMMIADDLVPIRGKDICKHHGDASVCQEWSYKVLYDYDVCKLSYKRFLISK